MVMDESGPKGPAAPSQDVRLVQRGQVHPDDVRTARETIGAVATAYRLDPAAVRVRLTGGGEPGGPMLVQVNFRVGGAPASRPARPERRSSRLWTGCGARSTG